MLDARQSQEVLMSSALNKSQPLRTAAAHAVTGLEAAWRWLKTSDYAPGFVWLAAALVMILCRLCGYHEAFMPQTPSNVGDLPASWEAPSMGAYVALYFLAYMRLFVLVGGVVYHVYIIRAYPDASKMQRPTWIASIYLTVWALASTAYDKWEQMRVGVDGQEVSQIAFALQVVLMVGLLLSPPFMIRYYLKSMIMERYVMRTFLQPLIFCFVAFTTLFIVMDLLDHLQDFRQNHIGGFDIAMFYIKLVPFIYVTVAPVTLLLATLYTLGRMSRTNELISMLGAGRSLWQVLRPIYLAGFYASFLGMVANYHWAPTSAGNKEKLLDDIKERMKGDIMAMGLVYKNSQEHRTWFIGVVPEDLHADRMRRIEVRQEDEEGHLVKAWFAKSATWWPDTRIWTFYTGYEVAFENGAIVGMKQFDFDGSGAGANKNEQSGWSETPWVLLSGSLTPEYLGVPQLLSYINANHNYGESKLAPFQTHLYYRIAQPWQTFIVVIAAAPLGIVFSRRGLLSGVASSISLFFFLLFIDHLFLNLGKGRHMPGFLAVWMPHLILGAFGYYMFRLRAANRELPKLNLKTLRNGFVSFWGLCRTLFAGPKAA